MPDLESPKNTSFYLRQGLCVLLLIYLLFELIHSPFGEGDLVGYVISGNLVLRGENIYNHYLNTWPPVFSVVSVPLSFLDSISPYGLRFIWLSLSIAAFWHSMKITVGLILDKTLLLPFRNTRSENEIALTDPVVFLPFTVMFKYLIDNITNIQINLIMLWLMLLGARALVQGKGAKAALFFAITLSLKVYTVFFLAWLLYKRHFRVAGLSLLFVVLINSLSFLVFGFETALAYYAHWGEAIAGNFPDLQHKNQSVQAALWRLMVGEDPAIDFRINLLDIEFKTAKKIAYLLIFFAALYPLWLIRKRTSKGSRAFYMEVALALALTPLLSPLSWKAYYIFLWPMVLINSVQLFGRYRLRDSPVLKWTYFISVVLFVFTSDVFVGPWLSDVFEVFSGIAVAGILQVVILLVLYSRRVPTPSGPSPSI